MGRDPGGGVGEVPLGIFNIFKYLYDLISLISLRIFKYLYDLISLSIFKLSESFVNLLLVSHVRKIFCTPLSSTAPLTHQRFLTEPDVNSLPFGSSTSGKTDRTVLVRKIRNLLKVWMSGIRNLLMIKGSNNATFILCFL